MRSRAAPALCLVLTLVGPAAGCAPTAARRAMSAVTEDYHDAQRWLRVGDLARQFACYDIATQAYRRVTTRYPGTRWGARAEEGLEFVASDAAQIPDPWNPALAGVPAAVQAQGLLHAGDLAYQAEDPLIALIFYERARAAAPGPSYAARASSRVRWVRRWTRVAP